MSNRKIYEFMIAFLIIPGIPIMVLFLDYGINDRKSLLSEFKRVWCVIEEERAIDINKVNPMYENGIVNEAGRDSYH